MAREFERHVICERSVGLVEGAMVRPTSAGAGPTADRRLIRGQRTREAIIQVALNIASAEGLEGVSIGRLAAELGVSKSGIFAHFRSKEDLQLAAINSARDAFISDVIARLRNERGIRRIWRLCDLRMRHMATAYPGGCFFYATGAEFDARPGPVRDRLAEIRREWLRVLRETLEEAQETGDIAAETDLTMLTFQLDAYASAANGDAALLGDRRAFPRARMATRAALRDAAVDPKVLPKTI